MTYIKIKDKTMKKIAYICILALTLASCATMQQKDTDNFEYYTLTNGIPLIVNKTDSSQIVSLQISVSGGSALINPEYSGLESALFDMMTMGSTSYSYDEIKQVRYETQGSIYSSSNQLGSILGLVSIDYYFDDLLPILIDGFLHPSFNEDEYTTLMTSLSQGLQYKMEDPNSFLSDLIVKTRYKGHPYETSSVATIESIENITIEAMKNHLESMHISDKISIVAVGNFDGKDLVNTLNKTLGRLQSSDFDVPEIPPASTGGEAIVVGLESAQGSGYIAYTVPAPLPGSNDEIAFRIAADIYGEVLFNLVREHYGATYSIGASYIYSKAPFGNVRVYKASDLENIVSYIEQAETLMADNKLISGKDDGGNFIYESIEDRLEGYKNTLINGQFYSSQTNAAISTQIISSMLMFDNPEHYKTFTERVRAVTTEDITRVFRTYWVNGEKQWFAVTGIGEENKFVIEDR